MKRIVDPVKFAAWVADLDRREEAYYNRPGKLKPHIEKPEPPEPPKQLPHSVAGTQFCRFCGYSMPIGGPRRCAFSAGYCVVDKPPKDSM